MNTNEIESPGRARVAGPAKTSVPNAAPSGDPPKTLTEIQAVADALKSDHEKQLALLAEARLQAAALQKPLSDEMQAHRLLSETIARNAALLETLKSRAIEYEATIDYALDHPEGERGDQLYRVDGAMPALATAERNIQHVTRWLTKRKSDLDNIETKVAELMQSRKHLADLLPPELAHLAK